MDIKIIISILLIASVGSGLMVISSKNPVHSVFYLVLAFACTSVLLLIMGVEFLSLLFLIVYVGAIAILFLFVVMMLNIKLVEIIDNTTRYVPIGFIIGLIFLGAIAPVLPSVGLATPNVEGFAMQNPLFPVSLETNLEALGSIIYTDYFLYFIIASLILLVAMIGAIILTIYHEEGVRRQDLFSQMATEHLRAVTKG